MALDAWLEQDIRQFLDDEVKSPQRIEPARLEDTASFLSDHNWSQEIGEQVKRGDVEQAKVLYEQLQKRFQQTPETHAEERAKLHDLLKEAYVTIANLVLDKYRTEELLRRMEASPGDPFNMKVKSVDLSIEDVNAKAPSTIDYTPFTKSVVAESPLFKQIGSETVSPEHKDHLAFDPEALLRANKELAMRVQQAQQAASITDQTVRDLLAALKLAGADPRGALAALDEMLKKSLAADVRAAATELRSAILDREEMISFTKQTGSELQRLAVLAQSRDALTTPTAERLKQQLMAFASAHPHYPPKHLEHIVQKIDSLVAAVTATAPQSDGEQR